MPETKDEILKYYNSQLHFYSTQLEETKTKIRKTSILRISIFVITIIGIYLASNYNWLLLTVVAVIGFSAFIILVIRHAKLFKQRQWFESLQLINQTELEVISGNTSAKATGNEWLDPEHPFADDLDIFGKNSLFQLIDRSATISGRRKLAAVLLNPQKDINSIKLRQKAIAELSNKPEFRQHFQASGKISIEDNESLTGLINWVQNNDVSFNTVFNRIMLIINPLIGFTVVVLIAFNVLNINAFFLFLALPFIFLMPKMNRINKEHGQLNRKSELLGKYAALLNLVEKENYSSEILVLAKKSLVTGKYSASNAIRKLTAVSAAFDYRLNLLVGVLLNVFFLWDILQLIRLEKWRLENKNYIKDWFEKLAQFDELCSFGGFTFNNPDSVFPKFSNHEFELIGKNVKHPFISSDVCIGNDVSITDWAQFHIITGANMAGKSTYLRTIGINMVLGMTGAPVLADRFAFEPVNLFTGIKTSDSLQEGESYFFAELKRLETIIRKLDSGEKLFIILDEILRGTNSADKQKGSKALVGQLIKLGASGMIATHDLTLGELVKSFPDHIVNKRFEVEITNNELVFDYKLKDGISQNLNATFLMKKMGITVE